MVECFDRMHLRLAESVLRPLRRLREQPDETSVTVRPPGRGRRVHVTVSKTRSDEPGDSTCYAWEACEVDAAGADLAHGQRWADSVPYDTPEAAFWAAVDAVAASRRRPLPV
jgi:hypothetical protein